MGNFSQNNFGNDIKTVPVPVHNAGQIQKAIRPTDPDTSSMEAIRSTNPDTLSMEICIKTKWNIKQGLEKQEFPAPTCDKFNMEGDKDGDIFFPASRPESMAVFKRVNGLIQNAAPVEACRPVLNEASIRNFRRSDGPGVLQPAMWGDEQEVVVKTLVNLKPKTFLEWGAGGSTRWFSSLVSEKVHSIDNYPPWCKKVSQDHFVNCLIKQGVFTSHCEAPEDGQGSWGQIKDVDTATANAIAYVNKVDSIGLPHYDAVFVDGRYRCACALKALNYVDSTSVVIMHDFWSRLHKYKRTLEYYDVIGRSRTVAILRKKKDSDLPEDWKIVYKEYSNAANQG